ncbi:hypothetical protein PR048_018947 [Dryococelus australis]|uniref:Protein kinase domain-containing protein n=1 Tax=Dryococelus australis TaxID=614101 RepID=A0ABQ9H237_9NEOP|nr:hypothetical protein PR048_018947 [Dryococelus australis]
MINRFSSSYKLGETIAEGSYSKIRGHGGVVVRLLSNHGEPGLIPVGSPPDFRMWKPCRTKLLVTGFSRGSPVSLALAFHTYLAINTSMLRLSRCKFRVSFVSTLQMAYKRVGEETYKRVACKVMNRQTTSLEFVTKFLPRELCAVQCVSHPRIVNVFDIIDKGSKVYVFMELCSRGDLLQYVKKNGPLQEHRVKNFFRQIVSAVAYLHSLDISHRDLKCENVFMCSRNRLKIGDFGFARWCDGADLSETYCGSTAYAAPEILQGVPYDPKLYDSWSLGCVLYIMLTSTMPFDVSNRKKMLKDQLNRAIEFDKRADTRIAIGAENLVM